MIADATSYILGEQPGSTTAPHVDFKELFLISARARRIVPHIYTEESLVDFLSQTELPVVSEALREAMDGRFRDILAQRVKERKEACRLNWEMSGLVRGFR